MFHIRTLSENTRTAASILVLIEQVEAPDESIDRLEGVFCIYRWTELINPAIISRVERFGLWGFITKRYGSVERNVSCIKYKELSASMRMVRSVYF